MKKRMIFILVLLALIAGVLVGSGAVSAEPGKPPLHGEGKILVRGSPIHGANGIIFDDEDRLHIASVLGREILVMDPKSGRILDRLGIDVGVEGPDDLAFGPDGSIYWTSLLTGHVGRLTPDGDLTVEFVAPGVNPITFSDTGRLFVAQAFFGTGLYELDPDTLSILNTIIPDSPNLLLQLNGFDFGPDGLLYAPRPFLSQVVRIHVDDPVSIETVADGFGAPGAVKFDSQGRLHVTDIATGEVLRVDTMTAGKELIATLLPGLDNLAFDSRDRLFISHFQDGSIFEVLPSGETRTVSKAGMIAPGGVAVLPSPHGESVFVGDFFTLREFNGLTGRVRTVERHLFGPGQIIAPYTVSAHDHILVLTSGFPPVVQVWDLETGQELEFYDDFGVPVNAIRFQGDLIVAELLSGSVIRQIGMDPANRVPLATGLFVPAGLAVTEHDLWVCDWATGMVWQIVANDVVQDPPILVAWDLSFPEGLAVELGGSSLLVVETGAGRLSRIDLATGEVTTVAEGLALGAEAIPGWPPTWFFNGVAVGPSGAIYVTGDIANVLYRFKSGH